MSNSYAIVNLDVLDEDAFAEYGRRMVALMQSRGARYLVRGGKARRVEGDWIPGRIVIIEYPSVEVHAQVVASNEYLELKKIRDRAARCDIIEVEGV